jgi:phosphoglycolate phosphatase
MTGRRLRLAVFDCDGTLVDSQHSIVACMQAAFRAEGLAPPPPAAVRRVVGLPLAQSCGVLAPHEPRARHALLAERYKEAFTALRARQALDEPLFDGIVAALDALEAAGAVLGVATGKGRRGLALTLERHGLLHRFATRQTADDAPGKPHPAMLEQAMAEVGVSPVETVMIGDTTFDMEMARAAGVAALGVAWGYHGSDELRASGALHVAAEAMEIPVYFKSFIGHP